MKAKARNQASSEVMIEDYPVFILVTYQKNGKLLKSTFFVAESSTLADIREYCKTQDEELKEEALDVLVDADGEYSVIFSKKLKANPELIFDPKISDVYLEYGDALQHYLGFYDELSNLLERPETDSVTISVCIDLSDLSKTEIVGTALKDETPIEVVSFQFN